MKSTRRIASCLLTVAAFLGSGLGAWSERPTPGDRWWIRHSDQLVFRGESPMGPVVEITPNAQGHDVVVYSRDRHDCLAPPPLLHLPDECRKCQGPPAEPAFSAPIPPPFRGMRCRCEFHVWRPRLLRS